MTSTSTLGSTSIVLQFELDRNIDGAARDVQAAINAARSYLPSNLPKNPQYRKVNPADAPILILALTSNLVSKAQMYDTASTVLAAKALPDKRGGTGFRRRGGFAVRVELDPGSVGKYGLGMNDIASAIQRQSLFQPEGQLQNGRQTVEIVANDQLHTAAEYRKVIVKYQNGSAGPPLRSGDRGGFRAGPSNRGRGKRQARHNADYIPLARRQYHQDGRPG